MKRNYILLSSLFMVTILSMNSLYSGYFESIKESGRRFAESAKQAYQNIQYWRQQPKVVAKQLGWDKPEHYEKMIELADKYKQDELVMGGKYKVVDIVNDSSGKHITLQPINKYEDTYILHISADRKTLRSEKIPSETKKPSEYSFFVKIALGAQAVAQFALNYPAYLYKQATPWLSSLRNKFDAQLAKLGFGQSE